MCAPCYSLVSHLVGTSSAEEKFVSISDTTSSGYDRLESACGDLREAFKSALKIEGRSMI